MTESYDSLCRRLHDAVAKCEDARAEYEVLTELVKQHEMFTNDGAWQTYTLMAGDSFVVRPNQGPVKIYYKESPPFFRGGESVMTVKVEKS